MLVSLRTQPDLYEAAFAARVCYDSHARATPEADAKLLRRLVRDNHGSVLEHLVYSFHILGISRACLQELVRHRHASYSVKSTRWTLKELLKYPSFLPPTQPNLENARKFLVFTANEIVDNASIEALENLRVIIQSGIKNDLAKYALPESFKTELILTINARALRHLYSVRNAPQAHFEIRELAWRLRDALPEEHRFLLDTQPETH